MTLFTRTGQITTNDNVEFDNPLNPANGSTYNPGYRFWRPRRAVVELEPASRERSKKKAASPSPWGDAA